MEPVVTILFTDSSIIKCEVIEVSLTLKVFNCLLTVR